MENDVINGKKIKYLVHFVLFELLVSLFIEIFHVTSNTANKSIEIFETEIFNILRVDVTGDIIHKRFNIDFFALTQLVLG